MLIFDKGFCPRSENIFGSLHSGIGKDVPSLSLRQLRHLETVRLPMHVHSHIDEIVGLAIGLGILSVEHKGRREIIET